MKVSGAPPRAKLDADNVIERIIELSEEALQSCEQLKADCIRAAKAKFALEHKKAKVLPKYSTAAKSQVQRDALAFEEYSEEYEENETAEALKAAAIRKVDTLRQVLSSLQTIANVKKHEANALQYGQDFSE